MKELRFDAAGGTGCVSRLEQRSDLLLSMLRKTVEAVGGNLSLIAEFPDRTPVVLAGISEEDHAQKASGIQHADVALLWGCD